MKEHSLRLLELIKNSSLAPGGVIWIPNLTYTIRNCAPRPIMKKDESTAMVDVLIIEIKGRGNQRRIAGYHVGKADIGKVTSKYADVFVHSHDLEPSYPTRINLDSLRISILESPEK